MGISRGIEWDYFAFVSYISGWSVQAIIINKINGVIQLEDGYVETKKIEIPLTKEFIAGMESCFEEINIFDWAKGNYNPCADGEQWSFEFIEVTRGYYQDVGPMPILMDMENG